jgi:hypothetical protein
MLCNIQSKYAKYVKCSENAEHTWMSVVFVLFQHRNSGTCVLFQFGIGRCVDLEQKQNFEPYLINPELKSAPGDSRRADEQHHDDVLAVCLLQRLRSSNHEEIRI